MTANTGPHDARRNDGALDRVIDDALDATLRIGSVDLRAQVLGRLDNPIDERPSLSFVLLRPALLPVIGAVLLIIGVAVTWRQVDSQLMRAGAPPARTNVTRMSVPPAPSATSTPSAPTPAATPARTGDVSPAPSLSAAIVSPRQERRAFGRCDRIVASSWLAMDALSRPTAASAESVIAGDDLEPFLPGAPTGDPGDVIAPMPRLRPIAFPPIVAAPIVDAPPVSTLAQPVSTLSTGDISRDRKGPGKPGGVRP